ncbi:glycosyltransferase 87 family protein [Nocardia sp. CNY236]|uniref:glycosyltransferase 87 family protein n=1 Tax=Nocardia sp. CNY236 TaxID=1169152 RepID=UPI00042336DD|nr:glycosyltransferase 87 family protein [Nocardia sp. CNY236]
MSSVSVEAERPIVHNHRLPRVAWLVPAITVALSAYVLLMPVWPIEKITGSYIDLQVYRLGVEAMLDGGDMYEELPPTTIGNKLPFIYPPFAALALGLFAFLPWSVAAPSFFVLSLAALALTLYLVARRVWPQKSQRRMAVWATACAAPVALLLEPVRENLDFGQVNLLLMALVAADCLAHKPRWRRGMLVGIAAAIKLTPAAFVLYFLVRRDYRAAGTAAVSGTVATALAFVLLPSESIAYWFSGGGGASSLSGSPFATNQSIQAVFARFQVPEFAFTGIWLTLGALLLALSVAAMRRAADLPALALAINAVFTLLISPISWSHHWVWIAPALFALVAYATRLPRQRAVGWWALSAVATAVFVYGPHNWQPADDSREFDWTPWQHIVGNTYVWFSVLLVVAYLVGGRRATVSRRARLPSAPAASP